MLEKLVIDCLDVNLENRPIIRDCLRILKPIDERLFFDSLQEKEVYNLHTEIQELKAKLLNQEQIQLQEKIQNQRTCQICFDNEIDLQDGVECSNKHFLCNECFSQHIVTKSNEDQQNIRAREGKVFCFGKCEDEGNNMTGGRDCPFEYTLKVIVSHGSEDAIESYTRNIARLAAWDAEEEQIRIQQQLLLQQQNQATEDFLEQFAKNCPKCKSPEGSHLKGHGCHHIICRNVKCKHQWCYVCQGDYSKCGCPFQGGTSCVPRCSSCRKKLKDDYPDHQCSCPRTKRKVIDCGCLPCNICKPGKPCKDCDGFGDCPSCNPNIRMN